MSNHTPAPAPSGAAVKQCRACGVTKPLIDFNKKRDTADGHHTACRTCQRAYNRDHYAVRGRALHLANTYGVSAEQYEAASAQKGGKCAICAAPSGALSRPLVVDHCHTSGAVRGLLCDPCNKGLGHFRDDPAALRAALYYLENPPWQ